MTAAAPSHPTTTARKRAKPRTGQRLRPLMNLLCDRCGRFGKVRLADWLCAHCRDGGAR